MKEREITKIVFELNEHRSCDPAATIQVRNSVRKDAAMTNESIGVSNRILRQQHRPRLDLDAILRKTLIILATSAVLGAAAIAPNAALAFGPPPPPPAFAGPPRGLAGPLPGVGALPRAGLSGPPSRAGVGGAAGVPRFGNAPGLRGGSRGYQGNLQGRSASSSYGRSGNYGYGRYGSRNRYYGAYVSGSGSSSYANDGCYYTYSYRQHRRVTVCSGE